MQNLVEYVQLVNERVAEAYDFAEVKPHAYTAEGKKYTKVIIDYGNQKSVHSFVNKENGDVLKPASWNAPAKGARYNLNTDMLVLEKILDPYGSYLYKVGG